MVAHVPGRVEWGADDVVALPRATGGDCDIRCIGVGMWCVLIYGEVVSVLVAFDVGICPHHGQGVSAGGDCLCTVGGGAARTDCRVSHG